MRMIPLPSDAKELEAHGMPINSGARPWSRKEVRRHGSNKKSGKEGSEEGITEKGGQEGLLQVTGRI